jgi:hypothetical protein
VLDRVAAAATHADHLDLRALVELFDFDHFDTHRYLLSVAVAISKIVVIAFNAIAAGRCTAVVVFLAGRVRRARARASWGA